MRLKGWQRIKFIQGKLDDYHQDKANHQAEFTRAIHKLKPANLARHSARRRHRIKPRPTPGMAAQDAARA